jgi:hypothetical protein
MNCRQTSILVRIFFNRFSTPLFCHLPLRVPTSTLCPFQGYRPKKCIRPLKAESDAVMKNSGYNQPLTEW